MKKGTFVVIEGGEGSGKQTQVDLLYNHTKNEGYTAAKIAFPRYETPWGKEIKRYLSGEYGSLDEVDPRFASLLYMLDRSDAQVWINHTLNWADLLVADRYSTANFGHQGAKFSPGMERDNFLEWLMRFEHKNPLHNIFPDKVLYLDIPVEFSGQAMVKQGRVMDIHEKDLDYRRRVRDVFMDISSKSKDGDGKWELVNCLKDDGTRYSKEELSDIIWKIVAPLIKTTPR